MKWIAEAILEHEADILAEVERMLEEGPSSVVPAAEVMKQAQLTLELLVEALNTRQSATLFTRWEAIGQQYSDRDLPMSDIPRTTDVLKRATWAVMEKLVESGTVKLADLVDAMMVVESVLTDCWFMMVHSYLGSRDIKVTASTERMEALYTLTEVLSGESDEFQMYRGIVDQVVSITGLPRCALLLFDDDGDLQPVAANYKDALDRLLECSPEELSALGAVISLGGPVVLERGNNPSELEAVLTSYGTPIALLVPLGSADKEIGVLMLDAMRDGEFTQEQIDMAIALASQAALAIEKSGLMAEMETRLKHMAAIGIVARSLTSFIDPKEQRQSLLEMGCALVRADSGLMMVQEEMFDMLEVEASSGDPSWARGEAFEKAAQWVTQRQETVLWRKGARDVPVPGLYLDVEAAILAPMLVRDKVVGVLAVGSSEPGENYSKDELEMFKNFAAQAAVSIENTQLYERLQTTYLGAIGALAAAIEARDPYTVGHSARVTQYAVAIAESMGMSSEEVEEIRLAGLLHDLGKIGVPDSILNKPGRLSDEEYTAIKMHPALSMRIIEPLPHLGNIIPIIYHHHERYDGHGYMDGKAGDKIPIGARIIAVADSYEAMTSDRPYRSALSREEAVAELRMNAGSQFDPDVVRHFLGLLDKSA
jgi:HD-GYP domain-containing protein (c-di-GMP phosphodiesterase class II)